MIESFGDVTTEDIYNGVNSQHAGKIPNAVHAAAKRKLAMINAAVFLTDLTVPPGNNLKALDDDLHGFHSIKVNDQYRIIFRWTGCSAAEVRVLDYH